MQVAKWGNSLAVRLPTKLIKLLELHEGDSIDIIVDEPRVFSVRKKKKVDNDLLARLRAFRGKLPADFHFSRDDANERH